MSVTPTPSGIPSIALVRQEMNVAKRMDAEQHAVAAKQRENQNSADAADNSDLQAQQAQQSQASQNSAGSYRPRESTEQDGRDRVDFRA
ncbi:MAG: hypothetical protein ABWY00_14660 [Dongiaceae bacterium]